MSQQISGNDTGAAADTIVGSPLPSVVSAPGLPIGGMEHAKHVLADYLAANLPGYIEACRAAMAVPAGTSVQNLLPDVNTIFAYEPPALDASNLATSYTAGATALVYVSCMRMANLRITEIETNGPDWRVTYAMQVITWVKGQQWENVIAASNNLITAVRACLLSGGHFGLDQPDYLRIDPNTYTEQAMEPEVLQGNRHVRPSAASFQMALRESMLLPPFAPVSAVDVHGTVMPTFSTQAGVPVIAGPFDRPR